MPKPKDIFQAMAEKWPSAIVARTEMRDFSGGAVSAKLLANADCEGTGPKGRFCIGRKVCYSVENAIDWLRARASK